MMNVKIIHREFGVLVDETFKDATQFKIFLDSLNGSLQMGTRSLFYNGQDFLSYIPNDILSESVIMTKTVVDNDMTVVEYVDKRSKMERLVD